VPANIYKIKMEKGWQGPTLQENAWLNQFNSDKVIRGRNGVFYSEDKSNIF
jgi:hypothetical protein